MASAIIRVMQVRQGIFLLLATLFLVLATAASLTRTETHQTLPRPATMEERFAEATRLHDSGDYAAAVALYEGVIADYPDRPDPYLRLAHTLRYWGKYHDAESAFLAAISLAPENAWAWTDLGKLYRNMGRYAEAEQAFLKSLELEPDKEETYSYGLGYLYLEMRRYDDAERMFKRALEIDPVSDMALSGLGDTYRELGRYKESEEFFRKTFAIHPHSEAYLGLAWLFIKQQRYADAMRPLQEFLSHIREKGEVYYALGVAYEGLGDKKSAVESFRRAVELNPENDGFKDALERARSR